jgi:hypothetical protein
VTLLLSLFLLFSQADGLPTAKMSALEFSAVKQHKIEDKSCIPPAHRRITFRIRNRSNKAVYIRGRRTTADYSPLGYLMRLDREKNQWVNPEGNTSYRPYKEVEMYAPDVYVLPPGGSMTFDNWAELMYVGSKFKQGIYISFSENEEPRMVTSEEFILR